MLEEPVQPLQLAVRDQGTQRCFGDELTVALRQRLADRVSRVANDQCRVRGDAGLAGIEYLAGDDRPCRLVEIGIRQHDGRALAAELQRHRGQMLGRGPEHVASALGGAGEEEVIPGLPHEVGGHLRPAQHGAGHFGAQGSFHQGRQLPRRSWRDLGGLQCHPVARCNRRHERREGELHGVVPGTHDPDHAQRLRHDPGAAGPEGQVDGDTPLPRPASQPPAREARGVGHGKHLGEQRLLGGPPAEVGIDRLHEALAPIDHGMLKGAKQLLPLPQLETARPPVDGPQTGIGGSGGRGLVRKHSPPSDWSWSPEHARAARPPQPCRTQPRPRWSRAATRASLRRASRCCRAGVASAGEGRPAG